MKFTLGDIIDELDGLLYKKAEAQLAAPGNPGSGTGNVVYGDPDATDGAGKKLPGGVEREADPADLTDVCDPQHEAQGKQVPGYAAKPQRAADGAAHTGLNSATESVSHQKASQKANQLLQRLSSLVSGAPAYSVKQSGSAAAQTALQKLLRQEIMKMAEEMAKEEKKEDEEKKEEDKEEKKEEKEASARRYHLAKQAGAQAAVQFLQMLQAQGGVPSAEMQKQAAYQEYMMSKQAGAALAEQTIQRLMGQSAPTGQTKRASTPRFVHPSRKIQPDQAYAQMMKFADAAGINTEMLDHTLTALYREEKGGGPPRPFADRGSVKTAADVAPLMPMLSGLLQEGTVSTEEKQAILDYVASAESMDFETLRRAVQDIAQPEAVLARLMAGDLPEHQRNAVRATSPEPSMPLTQASPSATQAEVLGDVSRSVIPGSLEEHMKAGALENQVLEAVLKGTLRKLNPAAYGHL